MRVRSGERLNGGLAVAFMFLHLEVDDYDRWKELFDSDPGGRRGVAKGHQIYRGVDDPRQVFVATEYESPDDAKGVRERLLASGALDQNTVKTPPTVVEVADSAQY
jgi:hypothetical protein